MRPLAVTLVVGVDADGARHATDHEVRVRVLATEYGMQFHHIALPFQRVEIMCDRHQVGFGRQFVGRVPPVAVSEDAQLTGLNKTFQLALHVAEVTGRRLGITGQALRQCRCRFRIGLQSRHHIHPVQRMQVIEVHHMVVDVLRAYHQVADQLRVARHFDLQRILDRAH